MHRRPNQAVELRETIKEITADAKRISRILEQCYENAGPGGLHFRFDIIAQSFFALGGGAKELEKLANNLKRGRDSISEQLIRLQGHGMNVLLAQANNPIRRSPSPRKIRKNLSILFVDSVNESRSAMTTLWSAYAKYWKPGRSVVSQAYAELVREWTVRTGNHFPISRIHSAGFHVESRGDLIDMQKSLNFKMIPGGKTPRGVALAALFDNKLFNYPYKEKINQSVQQQTSRGLTRLTFLKYDYLILFNYSDRATIERLKDAVLNKFGERAVAKGKAETIVLGKY